MIERTTYLRKLQSLCDKHLIKVITGIRRCGKSTLLSQFQEKLIASGINKTHIVSINFEQREHSQYKTWQEIYDVIAQKLVENENCYVFLDEVQLVPDFERLVDALFVTPNVDLYVTGANAYMLSSELATLLSGRYIAIHLLPLSFAEYADGFKNERSFDRLFRQYINHSCFPEVVSFLQSAPEMETEYLKSLYDTVVVKDIVRHNKMRKFDNVRTIIDFLFDSIGSIVSPNNIAETLSHNTAAKLSHNTVQKILRYLTESYLIYPVRQYNIKGKRILSSNYKYYVADLGLKNILQTNRYDADLGHKLENVVYFELLRRGGEVYAGKGEHGEVDFVVKKYNGSIEYYQVAHTVNDEKTLNREISSLTRIRDANPKFLLTTDYDNAIIEGVQKMNVIDWLLENNN